MCKGKPHEGVLWTGTNNQEEPKGIPLLPKGRLKGN